jgi:hypothetical protein
MSVAAYNHIQTTGSSAWNVTHGLNSADIVIDTIVDNGGTDEKILPVSVEVTGVNTVTINFSASRSGRARIVAAV